MQVTSLRGKSLLDRSESKRRWYLPIYPSPAHPESGLRLHIDNGSELEKASWVTINKYYTVPLAAIRNLRKGRKCTLDSQSYSTVLKTMRTFVFWQDISPPILEPTTPRLPRPYSYAGHAVLGNDLRLLSSSGFGYGTMSSHTHPAPPRRPLHPTPSYARYPAPTYVESHQGSVWSSPSPPEPEGWEFSSFLFKLLWLVKMLLRGIFYVGSQPQFWMIILSCGITFGFCCAIRAAYLITMRALESFWDSITNMDWIKGPSMIGKPSFHYM